jgi:serine protease Do
MNSRTRTLASFFTLAMAAMLLGAAVTTQIHPTSALARPADPDPAAAQQRPVGGVVGLDTFRSVARSYTAGVVNINTSKVVRRGTRGGRDPFHDFFGDDFLERFFGPGQGPEQRSQTQRSLGSGFIVDREGYILTNRHVVEGADEINVTLATQRPGERPYTAKLVGRDARTDIALLKIEPKGPLTALALGDSDALDVAEWVMAIGNPFGYGNSVTVGVVSYKGRQVGLTQGTSVDMIQTDAAINPGNSGGPLLNTRGEVIGINTLIMTSGSPQSSGVGFAVAINTAKEILPQLRQTGKVTRGWLGVQILGLTEDMARTYKLPDAKGAVVNEVTKDSPAEEAGIKPEDVVVSVDGRPVQDSSDLSRYVASKGPGQTVKLRILRNGEQKDVDVKLGTFPDETVDRADRESEGSVRHGMTLRDLTPELAERLQMPRGSKGVVVMDVEAGTAAENASLRRGDVIVSVNGEEVDDVDDFEKEIARVKGDGVARLRFRRGETYQVTALRLD